MKKIVFKKFFEISVYLFAGWGIALTIVFFAMKFGLTKSNSMIDEQSDYFKKLSKLQDFKKDDRAIEARNGWSYIESLDEWQAIKNGILKDREMIYKVSQGTGVDSRLIITPLVAEQLRLMTSEREVFKKYFQPLSILGTQTQFSLGIYGIKEKTAREIEANLKNKESEYYLGSEFENILDYKDSTTTLLVYADTLEPVKGKVEAGRYTLNLSGDDAARIGRLTNSKDHYYSYLYAAIYLKQIMSSWDNAGYPIKDRPEIVSTLYNIGFDNSRPNPDPKVGGAEIDLNGKKYSFGSIAFYFYFSDELIDVFPR